MISKIIFTKNMNILFKTLFCQKTIVSAFSFFPLESKEKMFAEKRQTTLSSFASFMAGCLFVLMW
jgi:hypothetical protein